MKRNKKPRVPLTGHDSSGLALLAQCGRLNESEIEYVLSSLTREARLIAMAIIGVENPDIEGRHRSTAEYFKSWSRTLSND